MNLFDEFKWRGMVYDATEGLADLFANERVTAYIGFDPTASSLHVGSLMTLMALALNPDLIIADEPTTALDVTVQAQILDLIDQMKKEFDAAVILITHDLGVVAEHCDDIMVMYAGRMVEYGEARDIYYGAHHPYTWGLLQSIARMDQDRTERLRPIKGQPPSLIHVPPGCPFNPRCPYVMDICRTEVPQLIPADGHHASACHLPLSEKERIVKEEVLVHS